MRNPLLMRALPVLTAGLTVAFLVAPGQPGQATTVGHATTAGGAPPRARVTGTALAGTLARSGPPRRRPPGSRRRSSRSRCSRRPWRKCTRTTRR